MISDLWSPWIRNTLVIAQSTKTNELYSSERRLNIYSKLLRRTVAVPKVPCSTLDTVLLQYTHGSGLVNFFSLSAAMRDAPFTVMMRAVLRHVWR